MAIDYKKIFKNMGWLAIAEAVSSFLKVFLLIYVARVLGPTNFGQFSFALAFGGFFSVIYDFGLSLLVIKEFSHEEQKNEQVASFFISKILASILAFVFIIIGSIFITAQEQTRIIIAILGLYLIFSNFSDFIYAFFRARQKMKYEAIFKVVQTLTITALAFFVLNIAPSPLNLSYIYLASSFLIFLSVFIFYNFYFKPNIVVNYSLVKNIFYNSIPLGASIIFISIYNSMDSVVMGYLGQIEQTGWYNAAYKIIAAAILPGTIIAQSFYPALSNACKQSMDNFKKILYLQLSITTMLALPLMAGGMMLAPYIIDFFYDPMFAPATNAFKILLLMAGLIYVFNPFTYALIALGKQKSVFVSTLWGGIANLILNILLIPKYSLNGAAVATVISYIIASFMLYKNLRSEVVIVSNWRQFGAFLARIIASLFAMTGGILWAEKFVGNVLILAIIGVIIYFATMYLLGANRYFIKIKNNLNS